MASGTVNKICNEVLCVLSNNYGKLPKDSILTIINLYPDDEIAYAKAILLDELKKMDEGKGAHSDTDNVYNVYTDNVYNVYEQLKSGNHELPSFSAHDQSLIPGKKEDQESLTNNSISVKKEDSSVKIEECLSRVKKELNQKGVMVKEVVVSSELSYPWSPPIRYLPDKKILEINPSGWTMELLKKKVDANKEDLSIGNLAAFMYKEALLALHYNLEDPRIPTPRNHQTSRFFRIGMFNANGATSKAEQLHFVIKYYDLDIFVIVETKLMPDDDCVKLAPNDRYKVVSRPRSANPNSPEKSAKSRGGGIAIIYGENVRILEVLKMKNEIYETFEALAVKIKVFDSEECVIVGIYRPGSQMRNDDFLTELRNFLGTFSQLWSGELLICGDFNYPGNTSVSIDAALVNLLKEYRLFQKVSRPTRNNNLLDLFICSQDLSPNIQVWTFDPCLSDHHLVFAEVNTLNCTKSLPDFPFDHHNKTALLRIVDDILCGMKEQSVTLLLSFNSDCKTLLHNRDQVDDLSDSLYPWLCSSLRSTMYQTKLKLQKNSGMGQAYGNSLFSVFYLMHTASSSHLKITCYQYSEDKVLIYSTFETSEFEQSLQILEPFTEALTQWYLKNKYINESNCKAIVFGTRQQLNKCSSYPSCFKSCFTIPFSTELNVLGVVLDKTLSFENHISYLLGLCNYANRLEDSEAKKEATAHIEKVVGYSFFFLQNGSKSDILHGASKMKLKLLNDSLQKLSISLEDQLPALKEFLCDIIQNKQPFHLYNLLTPIENDRTRSAANKKFKLPPTSKYYVHSFSYAAPQFWNSKQDELNKSTK